MTDPAFKAMSVEAYLRSEAESPFKREYVAGFVYPLHAQAGVTRSHSVIAGNIFATLHPHARKQGCRLHLSDMRLRIEEQNTFYYPDVMLVCDTKTGSNMAETAPCLLVEVLSERTAQVDRVGKYAMYTGLPGLQTYLLVHQDERRVVEYVRDGERPSRWKMREVVQDGELTIACLGVSLTLDDIFDGVL